MSGTYEAAGEIRDAIIDLTAEAKRIADALEALSSWMPEGERALRVRRVEPRGAAR